MTSKSSSQMNQVTDAKTSDSAWKSLYRVGGAAALLVVVFTIIQIITFIASPPPTTVIGWFTLFQNNRLVGLVDMDLLLVADNILAIPIFLALCVALRRASKSFVAIALSLGLVGIAAYFASNTAFNMLALSHQYVAAATDAQRSLFLAAGQAMLAIYQGTAFHVSYVIGAVALLIISAVMLRSNIFSKTTAYVGIVANVLVFGLYVPAIGIYLSIISVVILALWWILIARRLFRLGQPG